MFCPTLPQQCEGHWKRGSWSESITNPHSENQLVSVRMEVTVTLAGWQQMCCHFQLEASSYNQLSLMAMK